MKHLSVLLMKFIIGVIVFWVSLGLFFGSSFIEILSFSLAVTIISYVIGDQMLLPRIGKTNAVVADFFLTYLLVWIFGSVFFNSFFQIGWGSIIAATLIAGSEAFIHPYIVRNIKPIVMEKQLGFNQNYAFEFAEEQEPDPDPKKE